MQIVVKPAYSSSIPSDTAVPPEEDHDSMQVVFDWSNQDLGRLPQISVGLILNLAWTTPWNQTIMQLRCIQSMWIDPKNPMHLKV